MELRRYAAPAAFLLAATIAVVLVRSALDAGKGATDRSSPPTATAARPRPVRPRGRPRRFVTVRAGDTLGTIAARAHVSTAALRRLNPKVAPTSLTIGERIRVR